jgi:hypothetical protein
MALDQCIFYCSFVESTKAKWRNCHDGLRIIWALGKLRLQAFYTYVAKWLENRSINKEVAAVLFQWKLNGMSRGTFSWYHHQLNFMILCVIFLMVEQIISEISQTHAPIFTWLDLLFFLLMRGKPIKHVHLSFRQLCPQGWKGQSNL